MSEDFQDGFPNFWSQQPTDSTSTGWVLGTAFSMRSVDFPIPDHGTFMATNEDGCRHGGSPTCNKANDRLILRPVDASTAEGLQFAADIFYYGAAYAGAQESAELLVQQAGGTWTSIGRFPPAPVDQGWRRVVMDISAHAGNDSLVLAIVYNDGGGWPYGLAVDNIAILSVPKLDLGLEAWYIGAEPDAPYLIEGPQNLSGAVVNYGADTVQNFRMLVKQGGAVIDSVEYTGLDLLPMDTLWTTYPNPIAINPDENRQKLTMDAVLPNGAADAKGGNNRYQVYFGAVPATQTVAREVLLEHFTSTNCGPCAEINATYHAVLDASPVPANNMAYHVWWPYPTDPFYSLSQKTIRFRTLNLQPSRVPALALDGRLLERPEDLDAAALTQAAALRSPWNLEGELAVAEDGSMQVKVRVTALADHWIKRSILFAAITENRIDGGNPDVPEHANSETSFRDVLRHVLPDRNGVVIRDTVAGGEQVFIWDWDPATVGLGPDDPGGSADPLDRWSLTLYLLDEQSGKVLQSRRQAATTPSTGGIETAPAAWNLRLWPNPASERIWMRLEEPERKAPWTVEAYDALGRLWTTRTVHAADGTVDLDVSTWPNGHYLIRAAHAGGVLQRHVQVLR